VKLTAVNIINLGIIEEVEWQPKSGLNIITGETGAGKSLIIESLDTLLFSKADESLIRHGADETSVEAYFTLDQQAPKELYSLLTDRGIEIDDDILIVETRIKRQGRSIYRVNGVSVPRSLLSQIGQQIIDLHTQTQHLALFNASNHMAMLDSFGRNEELIKEYKKNLEVLKKLVSSKETLEKNADETKKQRDYLAYQVEELTNANLKPGEDIELEAELITLANAEKIRELCNGLHLALSGGIHGNSTSALDYCNQGLDLSTRLARLDNSFAKVSEELISVITAIEDTNQGILRYLDGIDASDSRLEETGNRLEAIKALKRKYNKNIEELIAYKIETGIVLEELENIPLNISQLQKEIDTAKINLTASAIKLHESRKAAARKLEKSVNEELLELDMGGMDFSVVFEHQADEENGLTFIDGKKVAYNKSGIDNIYFAASTNPGEPLKPLQNIASTGEASRFTLAVKNVLAKSDSVPIIIFDEIDIGVGGRSGEVIGKKLWKLARHHQVVCITHLPQIAVFADCHYRVKKITQNDRNTSQVQKLSESERLQELAEMLLSKTHSSKGQQAAADLVSQAKEWKTSQDSDK
jgi:DNA repair protein RecN (Recombination protein N)